MTTKDRADVRVDGRTTHRKAAPTGLGVAALGIVIFNVSPFLNWLDLKDVGIDDSRTGYAVDSLVPFMAYLGIGFLLAMVYAGKRARRGQHRGLTLAAMAVGIAATLQCVAFSLNPMHGYEDAAPQFGVFVGIIGAAIWSIGCGLLAKEIEGDDEDSAVDLAGNRR
jgi:hypothetical protein